MVVIAQGFWVHIVIAWEPLACVVVVEQWPCAHMVIVAQGFWVRVVIVARECCARVIGFCECIVPVWGHCAHIFDGFCGCIVRAGVLWKPCATVMGWAVRCVVAVTQGLGDQVVIALGEIVVTSSPSRRDCAHVIVVAWGLCGHVVVTVQGLWTRAQGHQGSRINAEGV